MDDLTETKHFDISFYISKYVIPVIEMKKIVIVCFLIGLLISVVLFSLIRVEYFSQATLAVEPPISAISKIRRSEDTPGRLSDSYISAEVEKLKSGLFAVEVFKILPDEVKMDLDISSEVLTQIIGGLERFAKEGIARNFLNFLKRLVGAKTEPSTDPEKRVAQISELLQRVEIRQVSPGIIRITAKTFNSDPAPVIVKSYVNLWLASNLEDNKKGVRSERAFAEEQKNKTFSKFKEAEKELMDFKRFYQIPAEINSARDLELQAQMERLLSNLSMTKERFDTMDKVYIETQMREAGTMGNIKILDTAGLVSEPSNKAGRRVLFLGIATGLLLGIGIVLLIDYLRMPIRHEHDITGAVHLPVFGHIPKI
ncbi:MAG: GNVR domain-containing protein [Desulfobacterales bacterium]|nr:GNVR domain-containing protein [Desulfobacterales bacterium]